MKTKLNNAFVDWIVDHLNNEMANTDVFEVNSEMIREAESSYYEMVKEAQESDEDGEGLDYNDMGEDY